MKMYNPNEEIIMWEVYWKPDGRTAFTSGSYYECLRYIVEMGGRGILEDIDGLMGPKGVL